MSAGIQYIEQIIEPKLRGVIRLSRWREHVPFTIPLTIVGAMMATQLNGLEVDWRLALVIAANILAVSFAFIINDVEDAPDDALDPKKKAHNVISSGVLSYREGALVSAATFGLSLLLYALSGWWALLWGLLTLVLSYLYSAYPFRLKARPITDVVSHALMLSGLLVMTGYFAYDHNPQLAWYVIAAATLFSAYGQYYNQVGDYEVDKRAGLRNTVVLLGVNGTRILMYGALVGAAVCMAVPILNGVFPAWMGTVLVIGIGLSLLLPWETDMRGNTAEDSSGAVQKPALMVANLAAVLWLAWSLGLLPMG